MQSITQRIAAELGVREPQIQAAVTLLDGGATVPFVARYRKEATGGLDDIALRALDTRLVYQRELEQRRLVVIEEIEQQGQLSLALRQALMDAATKQELEDLYLPFRQKRRTKGESAREAGWNHWPTCCSRTPAASRWRRHRHSWWRRHARPLQPTSGPTFPPRKPCSMGCATY